MWNQQPASGATPSAAGGSGAGSYPTMAHTPGSFAAHARSNSLANSPSAHRRAGAMPPIQHASSPSTTPAASRLHTNTPFPGTVAAPRSAMPPASASAHLKSVQYLSRLTERTPASFVKLPFPANTTVHWLRLQKPDSRPHPELDQDHTQPDAAAAAGITSTSTNQSQDRDAVWTKAVHEILTNSNNVRAPSRNDDNPQSTPEDAFARLVRSTLLYTSTPRPSAAESLDATPADPSIYAAVSDLWLFAAVNDDDSEPASNTSSTGVPTAAATSTNAAQAHAIPQSAAGVDDGILNTIHQQATSTSPAASSLPAVARSLPSESVKALARLFEVATVESGSYLLSSACPTSNDNKGKQPVRTSYQHQAHRRFMATLKKRAISVFAQISLPPSSSSPAGEQGTSVSSTSSPTLRHRLRLGDSVVFLPPAADIATSSSQAHDNPGSSTRLGAPAASTDLNCLVAELHLSLCPSSLLLRTTSRRLPALPLASTPRGQIGGPPLPTEARPQLHLSPLGHRAELIHVVSSDSIASDHLSQLKSLFASLDLGNGNGLGVHSIDGDLFADGIAVCALPPALAEAHASAEQASHPLEQPQEASFAAYPHMQAIDDDMGLDLLDAPGFGEQAQQQQPSPEDRRFLWPVSLCLAALDPRRAAWSSPWPGASANNDLQTIRSEPVTPLKELVSFTLKVLNDANESVAAQSAPPFTPGEPDDASLTRHRSERLSSARPGITPASMSFADFDLAMPSAASVTPSQSLPTVPRTDSQTSPEKREHAGADAGPSTNGPEQQFADDLSWMEFLPQATGEVPGAAASAAALPASSVPVAHAPAIAPPTSSAVPAAQAAGEVKGLNLDPSGSNWAFATGLDAGGDSANPLEAKQDPASLAAQALLQPQGRLHSSGPTPFQGQAATPLGFGQTQTKRKGEGDIFGNLGLLTEDDFSFFDESAFGLESPSALTRAQAAMPSHLDPSAVSQGGPDASANATAHQAGPGCSELSVGDLSNGAAAQPPSMSAASAGIGDVEMEDLEATNLDALFEAIPNMQDVMGTTESSQLHASDAAPHSAVSAAAAPSLLAASSSQSLPPVTVSFTPRSVSAATPFGDPASLPGFTPSSLTESSPAFGHANHKTPRTPFSPVEEYRDGATIVGSEAGNHHAGESAQLDGRYAHLAPQDQAGFPAAAGSKLEPQEEVGQLRLADASSAAAAAANAAMSTDPTNKKRPAIVPNAFLPLTQPQARKPLQRLTMGARANLGRKYDLFGKFASRPKSAAVLHALPNAANALSPDQNVQDDGKGDSAFSSRFALRPSRASPPKAVGRRGHALLQLRRDRNSKMSPGRAVGTGGRHSGQRGLDVVSTPRSSDDLAIARRASVSDSDSSSSEDDDEASDEAHSDSDVTEVTLSPQDQESMKRCSRYIVASYLCGAPALSESEATGSHQRAAAHHSAITSAPWHSSAATAYTAPPTVKRSMLSRTARWLLENPQFRSMYSRAVDVGSDGSDIATREKLEVLAAMVSALRDSNGCEIKPSTQDATHSDGLLTEPALPTLQGLVVKPASSRAGQATEGGAVQAEVLEPTSIAVGCQGSVVEALPSALSLWDKSKLSAVSGHKHVVAKVLLTHASPAWHDEIAAWLDRLRAAFEAYGLGTHTGSAGSILAMADGSEPLALSSYLERLWRDGEAWVDTLRSIASRVEIDVLQGRHVVMYALQPPGSVTCAASGFRGLLQLEADLRVMLAEQVGVLAEHVIVRPISPAMMTESGSIGFGQHSDTVRRLAFSVYDQLPRLVRRQPAKVLHGREKGPISAIVQFPAFSLATRLGRTQFALSWPKEPSTALDEALMLHVSYRVCAEGAEKMVVVSAIDERGGASDVDVLVGAEDCIDQVWRYAIGQASRARISWRLVISCTEPMSSQEQEGWQSCIEAYFANTQGELAVGSVVLLCVRPDKAGTILADVGARTRPAEGQVDKSTAVLLDASDCSQVLHFTEPLPLDWTSTGTVEQMASSTASAILVHKPRREAGRDAASHVLAVDVLQTWREKDQVMQDVVRSLHALRLVAEERHQLVGTYGGLPWGTAAVGMLQALLGRAVVVD